MRNRTKILLLGALTVGLTTLVVAGVAYWYTLPSEISIIAGPEGSPEHRFARRLAETLAVNRLPLRLTVETAESAGQALARFARHEADLAIVRTDEHRIPASARALAVLEHEAILVIGARRVQFDTLADLQAHKVAVIGRDGRNEGFLRRLLEQDKVDVRRISLHTVAPGQQLDPLIAEGNLVVMFEPLSRIESASAFSGLAAGFHGFSVNAIGDAKALERKVPGLYAETIEAGLLSGAPRIPAEDIETVALHKILVARAKMPASQVVELMRALFENGRQLGLEKTFATRIEPPDTDKGALIVSHEGATQYLDSTVETFFDRYSDLIYLTMSTASIFGSAAIALYSTVFRRRAPQPIDHLTALAELRRRARAADTIAGCDAVEGELDDMVDQVLAGLASGAMSPRGFEAFQLACEHCRAALTSARVRLG